MAVIRAMDSKSRGPRFDFTVLPSSEVHNLGVVFDSDLSLKAHVSQLTARCYSCLRRIKSCDVHSPGSLQRQ